MKDNWKTERLVDAFQIKPSKGEVRSRLNGSDKISFVPMADLGILIKTFMAEKGRRLEEIGGVILILLITI